MSVHVSTLAPPAVGQPIRRRALKKRRGSVKHEFDAFMHGKRHGGAPVLCIPRQTFHRLVKEIIGNYKSDLRIESDAITALQEDAELLLIENFKRCSRLAEFRGRETVQKRDWKFVQEDGEQLALPYSGRS